MSQEDMPYFSQFVSTRPSQHSAQTANEHVHPISPSGLDTGREDDVGATSYEVESIRVPHPQQDSSFAVSEPLPSEVSSGEDSIWVRCLSGSLWYARSIISQLRIVLLVSVVSMHCLAVVSVVGRLSLGTRWRHCLTLPHFTTLHPTSPHFTPLHPTLPHFTPLHPTLPHFTPHYPTSPHITPLHPTLPHFTPHHPTSPHITPLHPTSPHITPLHPTLPYLTPHYPTSPHITPLHPTSPYFTPLHPT